MTAALAVEKIKLKHPPLQLHYLGDRVLRQDTKRIAKVDNTLRNLIKEMLQTMYSEDGIGLAAPQVGINKRLIVADCDPENATSPPLVLVNPEIQGFSQELCVGQEGCLSIPEVFLDVLRPRAIEVKFKDESGRPRRMKASGLLARVIQHETDHLNGVLFVDRVPNDLVLAEALRKQGFSTRAVETI
ncbi:peptide deformylase [Rubidibacter lacunae KORDI 51-2]|uniref:Peptide deformylase n=1 Tax=Rubidibacter lacunae KORDI 51-2 TaxID=582515 RepID=U5DLN5_9CHRO|nr:peptide deformylase [Rubidibacter lacunae]ERN40605.1 peptide deformylase [Rubidibacter lacunae KORDI 51-2]